MAVRKKKPASRTCYPLISWHPERRASKRHILEAIRMAATDIAESAALRADLAAYANQCGHMQKHADAMTGRSLKDVARQALEYWRMRAFMPGAYGMARGGDRPAAEKWDAFQ